MNTILMRMIYLGCDLRWTWQFIIFHLNDKNICEWNPLDCSIMVWIIISLPNWMLSFDASKINEHNHVENHLCAMCSLICNFASYLKERWTDRWIKRSQFDCSFISWNMYHLRSSKVRFSRNYYFRTQHALFLFVVHMIFSSMTELLSTV
jgi:hypothetical protein